MADRRPWPASKPPDAALSIVAQRAQALRRVSNAEMRAFLVGLRVAADAATDLAQETYEAADRSEGDRRLEGYARAAGAKSAARRIGAMFDWAAAESAKPPTKRSVKALLKLLAQAPDA